MSNITPIAGENTSMRVISSPDESEANTLVSKDCSESNLKAFIIDLQADALRQAIQRYKPILPIELLQEIVWSLPLQDMKACPK